MQPTVSQSIASFKSSKKIRFLLKAITQVIQEKRTTELLYNFYCLLFFQPSRVKNCDNKQLQKIICEFVSLYSNKFFFYREHLISDFGKDYDVHSLPDDFELVRSNNVAQTNSFLIVGEYGNNSARIAHITKKSCVINNFYEDCQGVRHIHAVYLDEQNGNAFITTGDTSKFLDLWKINDKEAAFVKRLKSRFAGYTAIAKVNGNYYFGTDFSSRPNYIESLSGKKYFFPKQAYLKQCVLFYSILERYIVAINAAMPEFGCLKTVSIFDVLKEEFIFCNDLTSELSDVIEAILKISSEQNQNASSMNKT